MQALIDFIVKNLLTLWPIARVYSWEQGVRVRCGTMREELAPGLHWRWPFVDQVYRVTCAEQTMDLASGSITTTDDRAVTISANIAYRITSVRLMWLKVHEIQKSVGNVAIGFIASECAKSSWPALKEERERVQSGLAEHLSARLAEWGVAVTRVYITDMVEARQWRVFGDASVVMQP